MQKTDYNIALFVFFIPYILFEVPSNLVIKKLAPSTWLSSIMVLWGISTVGMGLVRTFEGLVAMRVLLGLFEAGLFPGKIDLVLIYWRISLIVIGLRMSLSNQHVLQAVRTPVAADTVLRCQHHCWRFWGSKYYLSGCDFSEFSSTLAFCFRHCENERDSWIRRLALVSVFRCYFSSHKIWTRTEPCQDLHY